MAVVLRDTFSISDAVLSEALTVIDRSAAATLLAQWRDDSPSSESFAGGFTIRSLLTLMLAIVVAVNRPATIADVVRAYRALTMQQANKVGLDPALVDQLRDESECYHRLYAGIRSVLRSIDPGVSLPAKRVSNAEHIALLAALPDEARNAADVAVIRQRTIVNAIVAASIQDRNPRAARGDVVADETILDLSSASGLGMKPDRMRGAAYIGRFYVRDKRNSIAAPSTREITKAAFGVGVTAVTRVGPPDALHSIPPLFVGVDIHPPTSGDVGALRNALEQAVRHGLLAERTSRRAQWPLLTVDMGYNVKRGFPELLRDFRLHGVARYPEHWTLAWESQPTAGGDVAGPIQMAGVFYCPAVRPLLRQHGHLPVMRTLLENRGFRDHDQYLRRILPFVMGRNSRMYQRRTTPGRPQLGSSAELATKIDLVCPAALGNLACPLRPESMTASAPGVPLAEPTWEASDKRCCTSSSVTVTLTADQERMAQTGPIPGTWEHAMTYESMRSLTERRFSRVKSRDGAGLADLTIGPRRAPFIALTIGMAFAAVNLETQRSFDPPAARPESIDVKRRLLAADLGHEPARVPPLS